ncbi:MAG: hypothetical protein V1837_03875 [Candidatus Woesearchaeota archaeon]
MNENKIVIVINKSIKEVFEFTTNPKNTHLWIPQIKEELSDKYPPEIHTIYKNRGSSGKWNYYTVIEFDKDKIFTLKSSDYNYFVRYTYEKLSETKTEMEYFEWVKEGKIKNPFTQEILQGLKEIMEK